MADGRYQSNAGRRKCILFLILLIVGLVIVLVYKPRSSSGGGEVTPEPPDADNGIVLDPLPDIPPRPGLEDGSEAKDFWQGDSEPIGDDDLRRTWAWTGA